MEKISRETISHLCTISCENVAERLGCEVRGHKMLCFMHEDHHPSLSFFGKNREMWKCFVCNKGGSAIDFVTEYTDSNFVEACKWLCQTFGISIENKSVVRSINVSHIKKKRRNVEYTEKTFSTDVAQWILDNNLLTETGKKFLFEKRLLDAEVVRQLNIVSIDESNLLVEKMTKFFDSKILQDSGFITVTRGKFYFRFFTPCLLFPYYDRNGILIGMQSRYLGTNREAPRFQFISAHKTRLFNLPVLNTIRFGEDLYISEGITDCLALLSAGKKAVAIPSATILPQFDLIKLKTYSLHMYPDKDDAGSQAYFNLRRFFINHYAMLKREELPEGVKDYSEYYVTTRGK